MLNVGGKLKRPKHLKEMPYPFAQPKDRAAAEASVLQPLPVPPQQQQQQQPVMKASAIRLVLTAPGAVAPGPAEPGGSCAEQVTKVTKVTGVTNEETSDIGHDGEHQPTLPEPGLPSDLQADETPNLQQEQARVAGSVLDECPIPAAEQVHDTPVDDAPDEYVESGAAATQDRMIAGNRTVAATDQHDALEPGQASLGGHNGRRQSLSGGNSTSPTAVSPVSKDSKGTNGRRVSNGSGAKPRQRTAKGKGKGQTCTAVTTVQADMGQGKPTGRPPKVPTAVAGAPTVSTTGDGAKQQAGTISRRTNTAVTTRKQGAAATSEVAAVFAAAAPAAAGPSNTQPAPADSGITTVPGSISLGMTTESAGGAAEKARCYAPDVSALQHKGFVDKLPALQVGEVRVLGNTLHPDLAKHYEEVC